MMTQSVRDEYKHGISVTSDVISLRTLIANVCFVTLADGHWVLIDAGIPYSSSYIIKAAEERFGLNHPPLGIVLTHGHFDHIGALHDLIRKWNVPIYAHSLELPYLTGKADYLSPDPTVGGGLMSWISPLYPKNGIALGNRVTALPSDGSIPIMPGWSWVHTPGHTQGHISLFRDSDGMLIVGDAFITVEQESALAVLTQKITFHGPPKYFTPDWEAAYESVRTLAALKPQVAVPGHGIHAQGKELYRGLQELVDHFEEMSIPKKGRYVNKRRVH